jgi:hypothetical protein
MRYLFLLFLFSFIFMACRKDEVIEEVEEECSVMVEIESTNMVNAFGVGSYWIYKNDSTGEEDSLYITQAGFDYYQRYAEPYGPGGEESYSCPYNFWAMTLVNPESSGSGTMNYWVVAGGVYDRYRGMTDHIVDQTDPVFILLRANDDDTLTINSNFYDEVGYSTFSGPFPISGLDIISAGGVGIIKWVNTMVNDYQVYRLGSWSLVRYHIEAI